MIFSLLLAVAAVQAVSTIKAEQSIPYSYATGIPYMKSAECARTTGKLLVLCDNGNLRPIVDENAGDDPGHALFLGIFAATTGHEVIITDVAILNAIINAVGLVALAALLWWLALPLASTTFLALGPFVTSAFYFSSQHTAQFGATCLAMVAPIIILAMIPFEKRKSHIFWLIGAILCLALASLLRQSLGLMGLVASLIALGYNLLTRPKTLQNIAFYVVVLAALCTGYKAPMLVLEARNFAYNLSLSAQMETHGIWHNLFIGLGAVPNPFGIEWLDDNGYAHAKAIDPSVQYISKHYYDVLKGAYFNIVYQHPIEVLRIYAEKFKYAVLSDKVWVILLFAPLVLLLRLTTPLCNRTNIDSVLLVSSIFICFFLAQATLFHWKAIYSFPIAIPFILFIGISIEIAFQRVLRAMPQTQPAARLR